MAYLCIKPRCSQNCSMCSEAVPGSMDFRFIEFNPRRALRGVEAARVEVIENGLDAGCVWMSERDIKLNLAEFGPNDELFKALEAYAAA